MITENQMTEHKVKDVIAEMINRTVEEIDNHQILNDDLGIDSIRILELLSYIEDVFQFELEVDDIRSENFHSVHSVIQFVGGKLSK